jgi:hypothetical protein
MGKKRRVENADLDQEGDEEEGGADGAKRRKHEAELQRQVEEYTVRLSPTVFYFWCRCYSYYFLTLNVQTLLAIASRSVDAQSTREGGREAQERGAGGASWDMGSLARHVAGREADGRKGSAQGHPGRQRLVGQVWSGQRRELSMIDRKSLFLSSFSLQTDYLSVLLIILTLVQSRTLTVS